ncbi:MAG: hypothetical protein M0003_07220 [Acidithiobacillus sp.]|nr:hypothetical protein [Acidithiobacillus sp.]
MELLAGDIDNLMGEFMRGQDVAMLKEVIDGDKARVKRLREEMTSSPVTEANLDLDMASHYRRGVQLCMRYAYWRSMPVPEGSVFTDASGCIWMAPDHDSEEHQTGMLVMRTAQDIPVVTMLSREEDESWLRAMGFLDALDCLQSH